MCNREVKFGAFYRYAMASGADAIAMGHYRSGEKDQSYFLWAVPKDILNATLFPIGNRKKSEVRMLAKKFNLPVAEKKDSQGICFLGAVSVKEFLEKELGNDNPALLYTLGQKVSRPDGPWYVVGKDVEKKEIMVSKTRASAAQEILFTDANWFSEPKGELVAQYRYRCPRIGGCIEKDYFVSSQPLSETPAPGQSIVFYRDDEMIGGGIIAG
jgi:tRNA-specific 2-thiouridylase